MKIPIRMIGLATTFFWIFLIVFTVSALYSVKDVQFDFGEPQVSLSSDNKLLFSLPIKIANNGYYNLGLFTMTTEISDEEGFVITQASTSIPVIREDENVTITHNVTMDFNDLLPNHEDYLFNDNELMIHETIGMRIAEVIPVQASTNVSMPWGAPFHNFTLGEIEYTPHNMTYLKAIVPISFENHAFFNLVGDIQIRLYNNVDALLGESQTSIEAQPGSSYDGYMELYVPTADITESGRFEVYFLTQFFNSGPLVIPYG